MNDQPLGVNPDVLVVPEALQPIAERLKAQIEREEARDAARGFEWPHPSLKTWLSKKERRAMLRSKGVRL